MKLRSHCKDSKIPTFVASQLYHALRNLALLLCRTKSIPGASVEHNKFCVSVHFRNCEPDRLEEVIGAVEAVLAHDKELKATRGRKVLEVRPQVGFSDFECKTIAQKKVWQIHS